MAPGKRIVLDVAERAKKRTPPPILDDARQARSLSYPNIRRCRKTAGAFLTFATISRFRRRGPRCSRSGVSDSIASILFSDIPGRFRMALGRKLWNSTKAVGRSWSRSIWPRSIRLDGQGFHEHSRSGLFETVRRLRAELHDRDHAARAFCGAPWTVGHLHDRPGRHARSGAGAACPGFRQPAEIEPLCGLGGPSDTAEYLDPADRDAGADWRVQIFDSWSGRAGRGGFRNVLHRACAQRSSSVFAPCHPDTPIYRLSEGGQARSTTLIARRRA